MADAENAEKQDLANQLGMSMQDLQKLLADPKNKGLVDAVTKLSTYEDEMKGTRDRGDAASNMIGAMMPAGGRSVGPYRGYVANPVGALGRGFMTGQSMVDRYQAGKREGELYGEQREGMGKMLGAVGGTDFSGIGSGLTPTPPPAQTAYPQDADAGRMPSMFGDTTSDPMASTVRQMPATGGAPAPATGGAPSQARAAALRRPPVPMGDMTPGAFQRVPPQGPPGAPQGGPAGMPPVPPQGPPGMPQQRRPPSHGVPMSQVDLTQPGYKVIGQMMDRDLPSVGGQEPGWNQIRQWLQSQGR